jgi:hypothetical protein
MPNDTMKVNASSMLYSTSILLEQGLYHHDGCGHHGAIGRGGPRLGYEDKVGVQICVLQQASTNPNRVRTLFTSVGNEADRVGPT